MSAEQDGHKGPDESADDGTAQRRHARVSVALLVQYRFGAFEEPRFDYALNVSESGLFIAMDEEKPIGTTVFVQLTTRDGQHFLQGQGRVVRAANGGNAIELDGFDEASRQILQGLVQAALEEQEKQKRPLGGRRS